MLFAPENASVAAHSLCLAGVFVAPASGGDRARPISSTALEEVSALVEREVKEGRVPGVAHVIMQGDDVLLARGFGRESVERENAMTSESVFALNSISKSFIAALILKLAHEGKLSLDDPVRQHLPEFVHASAGLSLRHLLTHTGGVREIFVQPKVNAAIEK